MVVFIDLHKALNTVDLNTLLAKLPSFGVEGVEHQWFQSYLISRISLITYQCPLEFHRAQFRPIVIFLFLMTCPQSLNHVKKLCMLTIEKVSQLQSQKITKN